MKQMIIPVDDKTLCIYPAKDSTILDCQIEHLKKSPEMAFSNSFCDISDCSEERHRKRSASLYAPS